MKLIKTLFIALFISALLFLPVLSQESQPELLKAEVARVVDGDTIEVRLSDGTREKVRYIGIDTPETVHPEKPVECFGKEASAYNDALVRGKTVWLELGVEERDKYGRLLAYVYLDPQGLAMVNAILVTQGYAQIATYPPNVKYVELFRKLQKGVREDGRGLWSACEFNDKIPETCQACLDKLNAATDFDFEEVPGIGDKLACRLIQAQPFEPSVCGAAADLEKELQKMHGIGPKKSRDIVEHFCPELY